MSPRVVQVIESEELRGAGTEDNPYRTVRRWHTFEGELLFELDPAPLSSWAGAPDGQAPAKSQDEMVAEMTARIEKAGAKA